MLGIQGGCSAPYKKALALNTTLKCNFVVVTAPFSLPLKGGIAPLVC